MLRKTMIISLSLLCIVLLLVACQDAPAKPSVDEDSPAPDSSESSAASGSKDSAKVSEYKVIDELVKDSDIELEAKETAQDAFGRESQSYLAKSDQSAEMSFRVDTNTGELISYIQFSDPAKTVAIDAAQAEATARAFAQEHYEDFNALDLEYAEFIDTGDYGEKYYAYWWIQRDSATGAYLPNEVRISVNAATGEVDMYTSRSVKVTVSTNPAISEEKAVEIVMGLGEGLDALEVEQVTLGRINNPYLCP